MSDLKKDENLQHKMDTKSNEATEKASMDGATENANTNDAYENTNLDEVIENQEEQELSDAQPDQEIVHTTEPREGSDSEDDAIPKIKLGAKIKESFHNRKFRSGAYTTAVSLIVVVIVLVVNIFLSKFDLKVDLSSNALFTLTDATKDYVATIEDDITIYYLVQAGNEYDYYVNLAEKYDALSDRITLEYKDPVLYPKFASAYTDAKVTENSVVVVNNTNGRSKYIDYSDMKETQVDYNTYTQYDSAIDFEGQVTSALQYVTNEELPVFYQVTGHDETEVGTSFSDLLTKQNVDVQTLSLIHI